MHDNKTSVSFRSGSSAAVRTVLPSQESLMLRFLFDHRHQWVVWHDLYEAIGRSQEVNRCLWRLRHKWGVEIVTKPVPNANRRGKHGRFRLGDEVKEVKDYCDAR